MTEKRLVKVGLGSLDKEMTRDQALSWGNKNMPADLKMVGFSTDVFASDREIHGGIWFRVSYCK